MGQTPAPSGTPSLPIQGGDDAAAPDTGVGSESAGTGNGATTVTRTASGASASATAGSTGGPANVSVNVSRLHVGVTYDGADKSPSPAEEQPVQAVDGPVPDVGPEAPPPPSPPPSEDPPGVHLPRSDLPTRHLEPGLLARLVDCRHTSNPLITCPPTHVLEQRTPCRSVPGIISVTGCQRWRETTPTTLPIPTASVSTHSQKAQRKQPTRHCNSFTRTHCTNKTATIYAP